MKILLSPAKTLEIKTCKSGKEPFFKKESEELLLNLKKMSKDELSSAMKIKGKILDTTYANINNFKNLEQGKAIESYNGIVFKNLEFENLSNKDYIRKNLLILDAFYGVLEPDDLIKPYRMDFKTTIKGLNLYDFWTEKINAHLASICRDEAIISLASKEYIKLIKLPIVELEFRNYKDGKYKNIATFSKMARGKCLKAMSENSIEKLDELKNLRFDGYSYNATLSSQNNIFFTN